VQARSLISVKAEPFAQRNSAMGAHVHCAARHETYNVRRESYHLGATLKSLESMAMGALSKMISLSITYSLLTALGA
jgi:hypothetical protein